MKFFLLFLTVAFSCAFVSESRAADSKHKFDWQQFFNPSVLTALKTGNEDTGDFKIGFAPEKGKKTKKLDAEMRKSLQGLADELNSILSLPADVYLTADDCGEPNAFYESGKKQLTMCYELYADFEELFKSEFPKEADRDEAVGGAFVFVLFHELGHALIDVYELPITGKEEDAVDQLSTWILTDGTDNGEMTALSGAIAFALLADSNKDLSFWDEHSLSQQRFYNTICLIYGNNPEKYADFVKDGTLPKNRAGRCVKEYEQIDRAWSKLLAPFVKK